MVHEPLQPLSQSKFTSPIDCQQGSTTGYFTLPSMLRSGLSTITSLRRSNDNNVSKPLIPSRTVSANDVTPAIDIASVSRRESVHNIDATRSTATSSTSSPRLTSANTDGQALAVHSIADLDITGQHSQTGGVDWFLAAAGVRLWLNAQRQADLSPRNPALLRSMHLDAVKYMAMALPTDLSTTELDTIRISLPPQLLHSRDRSTQQLVECKPNLLRQNVARTVCWVIALTMLLIPLLMTTLNRLYVYERKHRLTQRVLIRGADLTKALGERGVTVGNALVEFGDTPLGKAGVNLTSWFVEGIVAGVNDGFAMSTEVGTSTMHIRRLE